MFLFTPTTEKAHPADSLRGSVSHLSQKRQSICYPIFLVPIFSCSCIRYIFSGVLYSAQCSGKGGEIAEDVGTRCAQLLLSKISEGGCACAEAQPLILLFMALGSKNVSSIYFGKLSTQAVEALRLYKDFFGVVFRITVDTAKQLAKLSCFGAGFTNLAKKLY